MVDYEKLVDESLLRQIAATPRQIRRSELEADSRAFFRRVVAHIDEEMSEANVALSKRGGETIARNRLPSFEDVVFLAIGTVGLCRVELDLKRRIPRIAAVLLGSSVRTEIARKEYMLAMDAWGKEMPNAGKTGWPALGASAKEIAEDIIASIVSGKFE